MDAKELPQRVIVAEPRHLPIGFKLLAAPTDDAVIGYGGFIDTESAANPSSYRGQRAFAYGRRGDRAAFLTAVVCPGGGRELFATTGHVAHDLPVDDGRISARYHDGSWASGHGLDERQVGHQESAASIYWSRTGSHSVTLATKDVLWGVRADRRAELDANELLRIALSMTTDAPSDADVG